MRGIWHTVCAQYMAAITVTILLFVQTYVQCAMGAQKRGN